MTSSENGKAPKRRCFVITPIGEPSSPERHHADWVLNFAISPVLGSRGYEVFRSDKIKDPGIITDSIFEHIIQDQICIADLSFLNPNVFYELGVRHALNLPTIHIAHNKIRLPFDAAPQNTVFFNLEDYYSLENLKSEIDALISTIESSEYVVSNPMTHARGRLKIREHGDSRDKMVLDLIERVERLERTPKPIPSPAANALLVGTPTSGKGLGNALREFIDSRPPTELQQPANVQGLLSDIDWVTAFEKK